MLEKVLDYITVKIFGKYTLTGFDNGKTKNAEIMKDKYVLDSVFLDSEMAKSQLNVAARNQLV